MATTNNELIDGVVLKEDIYKDNTLLLKKGIILNAYLINKLNKFGIYTKSEEQENDVKSKDTTVVKATQTNAEVIIYQKNVFDAKRTKSVLEYAGFSSEKIFTVTDMQNLSLSGENISYIFVDSIYFDESFVEDLVLLNGNKKLTIFVLGCDMTTPKRVNVNTDAQTVKFLYRPLANDYIKALLNLYS